MSRLAVARRGHGEVGVGGLTPPLARLARVSGRASVPWTVDERMPREDIWGPVCVLAGLLLLGRVVACRGAKSR